MRWFSLSEASRTAARARIRGGIGVAHDAIVFASSAKLIARKRPFDLIDAVATVRRRGIDAHALFIGDGEERGPIVERARAAGIADFVTITGFVNQRELPDWYAAADTLVLPLRGVFAKHLARAPVRRARDMGARRERGDGSAAAGDRE